MAYLLLRQKKIDIFIRNYFTIGFFAFIVLSIFLYFLQINRSFHFWDEYGHWGIMNRESLKLGTFYSVYDSKLKIRKDYPPLFVLIELLWACFNRLQYSEGMIYVSLATFSVMLLIPFFSGISKKDVPKTIIAAVSLVLLLIYVNHTPYASDRAHLLNSIYVDWTLPVFAAYVLYFVHSKQDSYTLFEYIELALLLSSLLMMKQIGIAFYALAVAYFFYRQCITQNVNLKDIAISAVPSLLVPFAVSYSWKAYITYLNVASGSQFKIGKVFETVKGLLFGGEVMAWQSEAFSNFTNAILRRPLFVHPFPISYFPFVLITILLLLTLTGFKRRSVELSAIYSLGSIGYATMMLMLYVSSFGEVEGPPLASFDRYMIAYLYFGVYLLAYTVFSEKQNLTRSAVLLLFLVLTFEYADISHLNPFGKREKIVYEDAANELLGIDTQKEERILIINSANDRDDLLYRLEYYQEERYDILYDEVFELSPADYRQLLDQYDFVYLLHIDDEYVNTYWHPLNRCSSL